MTRNTKIVLGVVAGLLVLCMCAGIAGFAALTAVARTAYQAPIQGPVVERAVRVQPAPGDSIFAERAPVQYDLPTGWREDLARHIFGVDMTALGGSDGHSHIFLLQIPPERDAQSSLREALALDHAGSRMAYRNGVQFRQVGQTQATLRGQPVTMTISEGTNRDGETYRQLTGVAADGTAQLVVLIEQPAKTWDQAMVDRFIASIR